MEIVVASNNQGKINEFKRMLEPLGIEVLSAKDLGVNVDEVIEDGLTYQDNALLKAEYVYKHTGKLSLADDSGLKIDSLPDILGVHTARYLGKDAAQIDKNKSILVLMEKEENRLAHFESVLALVGEGVCEYFHGQTDGTVSYELLGADGFGYDPLFIPLGYTKSYAQMEKDEKNKISHRGKAVEKFLNYLKEKQ